MVGDSIVLAFGGERVGYVLKLKDNQLTISDGDLQEPMELKRIGPRVPRPEGAPLPPGAAYEETARQSGPEPAP